MRDFISKGFASDCSSLSVLQTVKFSEVILPTIPGFRTINHARNDYSSESFNFGFQLDVPFFPDSLIQLGKGSC